MISSLFLLRLMPIGCSCNHLVFPPPTPGPPRCITLVSVITRPVFSDGLLFVSRREMRSLCGLFLVIVTLESLFQSVEVTGEKEKTVNMWLLLFFFF